MPRRRIGASAFLDTTNFDKGIKTFIDKMQEGVKATEQFAASAKVADAALSSLNASLKSFASAAAAPLRVAQQIQAAASTPAARTSVPTGIQAEIEALKLLQEEYRALKTERRASSIVSDPTSSQAAKVEAGIVLDLEQLYRELRIEKGKALGVDEKALASLSKDKMRQEDIRGLITLEKRQAELIALQRSELQDTHRDQILRRQLASGTLREFERQNATLERQQILLRRAQRDRTARESGFTFSPDLKSIRDINTIDVDNDTLSIQRLITAEIQDRKREIAIENDLLRAGTQELDKQLLNIEKAAILVKRRQRSASAAQLAFDPAALETVRKKTYEVNDALQQQLKIQTLLGHELGDRIQEENLRTEAANRTTAAYRRQQIALQQQQIATRRQIRDRQAQDLGISPQTIKSYREANVEFGNVRSSAQGAVGAMNSLIVKTTAMGVAFGVLAASAIRTFINTAGRLTRSLFELVSFFERLELSVEFFVARSYVAEGSARNFAEGLLVAGDEAEGLLIWLQRLAVASPFTTKDVGTLFRTAQAYGLTRKEAELFTPLLLDFAAAAGLSEDILERLALAIGQIRSRGKLTGEEVRQLGNSGLPIRDILVKALGIANDQFDELLESGALTSDVVIPNIIRSLKDFEGQGERVAFQTLTGIVSAFKELGQISIARFFKGAIEPIRAFFKTLFDYLNNERFLAWIQVIGTEVGETLLVAFQTAQKAVAGFFQTIRDMDPTLKAQIVVFAAATVGALALAASLGAVFLAVNLLLQPVVLLSVGIGLLVSEWSVGFKHVLQITRSAGQGILAVWSSLATGAGTLIGGVTDAFSSLASGIGEFFNSVATIGLDAAVAFTEGWTSGFGIIGRSLMGIGAVFNAILGVHSNPPAIPNLDRIGEPYMPQFAHGVIGGSERAFGAIGEDVRKKFEKYVFVPAHIKAAQAGRETGEAFTDNWQNLLKRKSSQFGTAVVQSIEAVTEEAGEAAGALALHVSEAFVDSFRVLVPTIKAKISDELADLLAKIGGGRQLSTSGIAVLDSFLKPFTDPDFSAFGDIVSFLRTQLQSLAQMGEIDELDVPRILFGARTDIARAIDQVRTLGSATSDALGRVARSAGGAGKRVVELIQSYTTLAADTKLLEDSQKKLTEVSEKYKNILTPIREELEKISDARRIVSEDRQIIEFQRVIANEAASFARKREAELGIAEILQQRRVRTIEKERDAIVDATDEEIDARQKVADKSRESFDLLKSRFDEQNNQLGLVADEASMLDKLNEQADKLKEKQKSGLELQLELQKLQQAEIRDTVKATKAKYILDQADSTELEKIQAQQDLIEVALERQQRLRDAQELGVSESELRRFRDIVLTLDDIGIKDKKVGFEAQPLNVEDFGGPNAQEITEQWKRIVDDVEAQWLRLKTSITDTFTEINNNLPAFLRFLPDEKGNVGILTFLETWNDALIAIGITFATYRIIKNIVEFSAALKIMLALKGVQAAAAGGGLVGAIVNIAVAAKTLSGPLGLAAAEIWVFIRAWEAFINLLDAGPTTVQPGASDADPAARARLMGRESGLNIRDSQGELVSVDDLVISEDAAERAALESSTRYYGSLVDTLKEPAPIVPLNINSAIVQTLKEGTPSAEQFTPNLSEFSAVAPSWTSQLYNYFEEALVASDNKKRMNGAMLQTIIGGMPSPTDISVPATQVGADLSAGIADGMNSEEANEAMRLGGKAFMQGAINILREEAGVQSPSTLFAEHIGVPIAEGIIEPLKNLGERFSGSEIVTSIIGFFSTIKTNTIGELLSMKAGILGQALSIQNQWLDRTDRTKRVLVSRYELMRQDIVGKASGLNADLLVEWITQRETLEGEVILLKGEQLGEWELIKSGVIEKASTMNTTVVGQFNSMRLGAEEETKTMKTNLLGLLVNNEDSLLREMQRLFVGAAGTAEGTGGSGAWQIGANWILGMSKGITDTKALLLNAMTEAIEFAYFELKKEEESFSPSRKSARQVGVP